MSRPTIEQFMKDQPTLNPQPKEVYRDYHGNRFMVLLRSVSPGSDSPMVTYRSVNGGPFLTVDFDEFTAVDEFAKGVTHPRFTKVTD